MNRIYSEYAEEGLEVISINVQEDEKKIADFVRKKKITYKVLLDMTAEAAKKFKVYGIPTNILINPKGIITFRGYDLPEKEEIKKVLVKPKTKSKKGKKEKKK